MPWIVSLHLFATFFMTGLIWFVQLVHYPLFSFVPDSHRPLYSKKHGLKTSFIVLPMMTLEIVTGMMLYFKSPDTYVWAFGALLLLAIWALTLKQFAPLHQKLSDSGDSRHVLHLVRYNWLRTVFWSARSILVFSWLLSHLA